MSNHSSSNILKVQPTNASKHIKLVNNSKCKNHHSQFKVKDLQLNKLIGQEETMDKDIRMIKITRQAIAV